MSHIGPLTNNPSEAKRLQVIRPQQATPMVQKLTTKSDENKKTKIKNKNEQNRRIDNKTDQNKKRKQNNKRKRNRKMQNDEMPQGNFDFKDAVGTSNTKETMQKVIRFLSILIYVKVTN